MPKQLNDGWYKCKCRGSDWLVRYVKNNKSHLCDPNEFEAADLEIPERVFRGSLSQYEEIHPINLDL